MSKRQFLEKMVESLIDNNIEDARGNFHQFVVESAREIHGSLIETDELEDDLDTVEEVVEEAEGEDFGAEIEADGDVAGDDMGGDDFGGEEVGGDVEGGEEATAEPVEVDAEDIDAIKAQLEELQAKFDALTGGSDVGGEEVEVDAEVIPGDEFGGDDFGGEGEVEEGFDTELTEDDLLGLEEAFSEIKVSMDGKEQGGGKFAGSETNTETPLACKEEGSVKATDLMSKKDNHSGYEREKAPEAPMKSDSENVSANGKGAWKDVHVKMDGQEQGGGKFAGGEKNTKTPVAKN